MRPLSSASVCIKHFLRFEEQTPKIWEDQRLPFSSYGFYAKSSASQVRPCSPQEDLLNFSRIASYHD